jgi:hypothetical protein
VLKITQPALALAAAPAASVHSISELFPVYVKVAFLTSSRSILQESRIDCCRWQVHIPHDTASDEDILHRTLQSVGSVLVVYPSPPSLLLQLRASLGVLRFTYQMRVLHLLHHGNIFKLNVQVLIHALKRSADRDVVFELDRDLMVDESLEETIMLIRIPIRPTSEKRFPNSRLMTHLKNSIFEVRRFEYDGPDLNSASGFLVSRCVELARWILEIGLVTGHPQFLDSFFRCDKSLPIDLQSSLGYFHS